MTGTHTLRARNKQPALLPGLFFLLALLVLCVLVATLYLCRGVLIKLQCTSANDNLHMYVESTTSSAKSLTEVASQVSYNSYISDWVNTSHIRIDRSNMRKILDNHSSIVTSNPLIFSIDIFSANSNMILSTHSGYYDVSHPPASAEIMSQLFADWNQERHNVGLFSFIGCEDPDKGMGNLVYMNYISNTGPQGVVAITSKVEYLLQENVPASLDLYVYDPQNAWICPVNGAREEDYSARLLLQISQQQSATDINFKTLQLGDSTFTLFAQPVLEDQLYIIALLQNATLKSMIQEYWAIVSGMCILAAGIVLFLSRFIIKMVYRPIQNILDTASENNERLPSGKAIWRLSQLMDNYNRQREALQRSMDINRQYLHERQIKDIIFGSYSPRGDDPVPMILSVTGQYLVMVATSAESEKGQESLNAFAQETISILHPRAKEFLFLSKSSAVILMCLDERWNSSLVAYHTENSLVAYKEKVVVGISSTAAKAQQIPLLYEQAWTARRNVREQSAWVLLYQKTAPSEEEPSEQLHLWNFITVLRTQTKECVEQELQALLKAKEEIPSEKRQALFLYLIYSIIRTYKDCDMEIERNVFSDIMELTTDSDRFSYALALCDRFILLRDESNKKYKRASVEAAVQYLRLNFDKPISLSILADELGISPSYLSELLKKELNMNYLNYVHELRIDRAKELLAGTELTIQQISQTIGYDTVHSFIRNFKKIMGTTPTAYRMQTSVFLRKV